jgi:hypothetical protein
VTVTPHLAPNPQSTLLRRPPDNVDSDGTGSIRPLSRYYQPFLGGPSGLGSGTYQSRYPPPSESPLHSCTPSFAALALTAASSYLAGPVLSHDGSGIRKARAIPVLPRIIHVRAQRLSVAHAHAHAHAHTTLPAYTMPAPNPCCYSSSTGARHSKISAV